MMRPLLAALVQPATRLVAACSDAATRPEAEDDARHDPDEPPEDGGGEDDPDERGMCRADHPIQLHRARVCSDEQDENDERGHEQGRPDVEARPTAKAAEALPPRFDGFPLRLDAWLLRLDDWFRLLRHLSSSPLRQRVLGPGPTLGRGQSPAFGCDRAALDAV